MWVLAVETNCFSGEYLFGRFSHQDCFCGINLEVPQGTQEREEENPDHSQKKGTVNFERREIGSDGTLYELHLGIVEVDCRV